MNPQLEEMLYKKYHNLFEQRTWSKRDTCMCWGIAVGDGWYGIIDDLCRKIMDLYVERESREIPRFSQIKEKFGLLRIYFDPGEATTEEDYKAIEKLIAEAEGKSAKTCEECGETKDVSARGSWIKTRCRDCHKRGN